jgi:hypothetical protein
MRALRNVELYFERRKHGPPQDPLGTKLFALAESLVALNPNHHRQL